MDIKQFWFTCKRYDSILEIKKLALKKFWFTCKRSDSILRTKNWLSGYSDMEPQKIIIHRTPDSFNHRIPCNDWKKLWGNLFRNDSELMQTQSVTSLLLMLMVDHNKNIVIKISVLKWYACVCVCVCCHEIAWFEMNQVSFIVSKYLTTYLLKMKLL